MIVASAQSLHVALRVIHHARLHGSSNLSDWRLIADIERNKISSCNTRKHTNATTRTHTAEYQRAEKEMGTKRESTTDEA